MVTELVKRVGRPPQADSRDNKKLTSRVLAAKDLGIGRLAARYPELMDLAISLAVGGEKVKLYNKQRDLSYEITTAPNPEMIRFILGFFLKLIGQDNLEATSPIKDMLGGLRTYIDKLQINISEDGPVATNGHKPS